MSSASGRSSETVTSRREFLKVAGSAVALQRVNRARDIQVERHVWIGIGALVFSGSHLKEGCMVGAGTLVKETTIPAACVVVGRPARIVRRSVRWERDRQRGKP